MFQVEPRETDVEVLGPIRRIPSLIYLLIFLYNRTNH